MEKLAEVFLPDVLCGIERITVDVLMEKVNRILLGFPSVLLNVCDAPFVVPI